MKFNILHNNTIFKIIIIFTNIFLPITYSNLTNNQNKPIITISSNSQTTNISNNTITFRGQVTLKYQNINVHADEIFIQNTKKNYALPIIKAYGNPVNFYHIQKSNNIISAQSLAMHYNPKDNIVTLIGDAYIKQAENFIYSDNITYIIKDKTIKATANQNNQVITTFSIKN